MQTLPSPRRPAPETPATWADGPKVEKEQLDALTPTPKPCTPKPLILSLKTES